jgi:hypothetical protein
MPAVVIVPEVFHNTGRRYRYTMTFTADGEAVIVMPDRPSATVCFQSNGNDGGGTLAWTVSLNGSDYVGLGVVTAQDPKSVTGVLSATAAGAWVVDAHDMGWAFVKFALTGSTGPSLVVVLDIVLQE